MPKSSANSVKGVPASGVLEAFVTPTLEPAPLPPPLPVGLAKYKALVEAQYIIPCHIMVTVIHIELSRNIRVHELCKQDDVIMCQCLQLILGQYTLLVTMSGG